MKKEIFVKVAGIKNENLEEIKEVEKAIGTIRAFARNIRNQADIFPIKEKAVMQGEEDKENNLCLYMTVDAEGIEDVIGEIVMLTEKLGKELEKMDEKIIIGIRKEPAKN